MFSCMWLLRGLPPCVAFLWTRLCPTADGPSSKCCTLLLPGDNGAATLCGRPSLTGLSRMPMPGGAASFRPSKAAVGRSWAPGGTVRLLGLPCGVLTGVVKLVLIGVEGRLSCFPPGNRLAMKLAMAVSGVCRSDVWRCDGLTLSLQVDK